MRYYLLVSLIAALFSCQSVETVAEKVIAEPYPLGPFVKADSVNPILEPRSMNLFACPVQGKAIAWEAKDVFNPAVVVREDTVWMLYRAEDEIGKYGGTSRIGLAHSTDGLHFNRLLHPVLFPQEDAAKIYEWEGGCEDPRVVEDANSVYWMTYTAYDGKVARLMVASSADLLNWQKHGPAFAEAAAGKYLDLWSKSGAIVCERVGDQGHRLAAVKIRGKYWMYWGDTDIFLATSEDLRSWTPVANAEGVPIPVFGPRSGMFDSRLVEPGPPAILTDSGILLLYNGMNLDAEGDPNLGPGTYSSGQILLHPDDPSKVLQRTDHYFLRPEAPYELTGQVNQVVFIEGLAFFQGKAFLYYGTADSKIAVAVAKDYVPIAMP